MSSPPSLSSRLEAWRFDWAGVGPLQSFRDDALCRKLEAECPVHHSRGSYLEMKIVFAALAAAAVSVMSSWDVAADEPQSKAAAVRQAHEDLKQWLGRNPPHAVGWRAYLLSDQLDQQVALGEKADQKVLETILARYS